jgi:hypothetical protein
MDFVVSNPKILEFPTPKKKTCAFVDREVGKKNT